MDAEFANSLRTLVLVFVVGGLLGFAVCWVGWRKP
jgi:hypothetical protein